MVVTHKEIDVNRNKATLMYELSAPFFLHDMPHILQLIAIERHDKTHPRIHQNLRVDLALGEMSTLRFQ